MPNTWNLQLLYKSPEDPQIQKDIETCTNNVKTFVNKWKSNKEYTKNPSILAEALKEYEHLEKIGGICNKPMYYFWLKNNLDQTDAETKAKLNQISDICTKLENEIQFFNLNISKIPKSNQKKFLNYDGLKEYKHYLEESFASAKYTLSDKEEKIFNLTSKTSFGNWVDMVSELLDKQKLTILDEKLEKKDINYNDVNKYLESQNKKVRDYAIKEYNKINNKYLEIAEFEMNSILERKKISDEYRKIPRPDTTRHLHDDIDTDIVDTLIKVVTDNFDISQQYYKRKTEILGLKKLGYYERKIPLTGIEKEYTYPEALDLVKDTFNNLDPLFSDIVSQFQTNGQYDVNPGKGKSGGAFCISFGKMLPTYILLNFKNRLSDVTTIAHESGHGIHTELSKKQVILNSGYPTSLAEIASTFFEDFVLDEVLKTTNDSKTQRAILDMKIGDEVASIFRQVAFYNFEKELHHNYREKGFLTKEYISELFCKHMKSYMGEAVEEDESMRNGWIYISHFRSFFYVYSYASGLLISKSLQALVKENKENISLVKTFLQSGSSKSPKDLFMGMGIDISKEDIWKKGINSIRNQLTKL